MNKRQKMTKAKELQKQFLNSFDMTGPETHPALGYAESQDCLYLRIVVEEVRSGGRMLGPIYTVRKRDDLGKLCQDLEDAAVWPREILACLRERLTVNGELWIDLDKTMLQVYDRQLSGGRTKSDGISEDTAENYKRILRELRKSGLGQREYCRETDTSYSTLRRAIKYEYDSNHRKKIQRMG